jgi:SAM-dependent methyltransferase
VTRPHSHVYDSARVAQGYAFGRPSVHPRIIEIIGKRLGTGVPVRRALDVGCGAGLSAAALDPIATTVVGMELSPAMLAYRADVAPHALFAAGQGEALPFITGAFDLVTSAGAINYMDRDRFLSEAARVLTPDGALVIYDFSAGRRFRDGDPALDDWYHAFERRYPPQPGYDLDARTLAYEPHGLRLDAYEELDVAVPMTAGSYLRYAMSETNVEMAIAVGDSEADIRAWCRETLQRIFGGTSRDVLFDAYLACIRGAQDHAADRASPRA